MAWVFFLQLTSSKQPYILLNSISIVLNWVAPSTWNLIVPKYQLHNCIYNIKYGCDCVAFLSISSFSVEKQIMSLEMSLETSLETHF